MRGAIASVEIYVRREEERPRRLSLTIACPEREGDGWSCRLALADLHRPRAISGADSVDALARALGEARKWIEALIDDGFVLTRDRRGEIPFELF